MNYPPSHHRFRLLVLTIVAFASLLLSGCANYYSGGYYPRYSSNPYYHGYSRHGYHGYYAPHSGFNSGRYWHGGFGHRFGGGHFGGRH